ncbi:MAG: hypothetical protein PUC12_11910 [Clostridiales bacterium]|nr:hypothetical protein [Clostridiales bacterium]
MKIAVLSDTHNLLRNEVEEIIRECDAVIQGGGSLKSKSFFCKQKKLFGLLTLISYC